MAIVSSANWPPVSEKKVITVSAFCSLPCSTRIRSTAAGNAKFRGLSVDTRDPVDGSAPMYCAMSGVMAAWSNVPTIRKAKSAALPNRAA